MFDKDTNFIANAEQIIEAAKAQAARRAAGALEETRANAQIELPENRRAFLAGQHANLIKAYRNGTAHHAELSLLAENRANLAAIIAGMLERGAKPAAIQDLIARAAFIDACRLTAEALAEELEGRAASAAPVGSAEGMNDSKTAEKARALLSKMKMLDNRGKLCQPLDCEHDLTTIARALYRALEKEMKGNAKDEQFSQILKNEFGRSITARTLRGNSTVRDKQKAERTLSEAFKALI